MIVLRAPFGEIAVTIERLPNANMFTDGELILSFPCRKIQSTIHFKQKLAERARYKLSVSPGGVLTLFRETVMIDFVCGLPPEQFIDLLLDFISCGTFKPFFPVVR